MNDLEERNLVWSMLELLIEKHELENDLEFLDPATKDNMVFGNFVKGHPMCFNECMQGLMADLSRHLPSDYEIARDYIIDDGSAVIGITKK